MEQCEQRLLFTTVSGTVFADSNGDGLAANERGMPDWVVFVDVDDDGSLGLSEPYAITAVDGTYSIDAGTAHGAVRTVLPDGWHATSPTSDPELGETPITVDFGLTTTRPLAVTGFETLLDGRDARLTLTAAVDSVRAWHVNWGDDTGVRTYGVAAGAFVTTVVHHYVDGPNLYPVWVEATLSDGNTVSVWTPDPEFGGETDGVRTFDYGSSLDDAFEDVVVQSDGKIVAAGWAQVGGSSQTKRDFVVARFNEDGSYDTTFNAGGSTPGVVVTNFSTRFDRAIQVELFDDGSILVGGWSNLTNGRRVAGLAKYTTSGVLDTSFGTGGKLQSDLGSSASTMLLRSMAIDSEDRILLVGADSTHIRIGRFDEDGAIDTTFGTSGLVSYDMPELFDTAELILAAGGEEYVEEASYTLIPVSIDGNGNVGAVTGYNIVMYDEETFEGNFLLRLTDDGSRDTTFATDGLAQVTLPFVVSDVRPLPEGGVVLGGHKSWSTTQSDFAVAKFTDDGVLDTSFGLLGTGVSTLDIDSRRDIAVRMDLDSSGRITLVGTTGAQNGMHSFSAVRFTAGGLLDTTFGNIGILSAFVADDFARSAGFALDPSGSFVIVGQADEEASETGLDAVILRMVDDGVSQRVFEPTITVSQPVLSTNPLEVRYQLELDGETTIGQWLIDWGDGEQEEVVESGPLDVSHEYSALGEYTVRITGLTKAGPLILDTRSVVVAPDGPWAGAGSLTQAADAYLNSLLSLVRRDTQVGDWTVIEVDWGDGLIETFDDESDEIVAVNANGAVPLRHAYTSPGDFTVTVTVSDGTGSFAFSHDWRIGLAWAPPESAAAGIYQAPDDPDDTANLTVSWDYRGIGTIFDAFEDEIGYFLVQDPQGGVVSGAATLYPGDAGYQDAALASTNSAVLFASGLDPRDDDDDDDDGILDGRIVLSVDVPSNTYLGFYVIQGATTSEWRSRGTGMIPDYNAWFSVQGANADEFVHFQSPNTIEPFYRPDTFQLWVETASPFIENIGADDLPWMPRDVGYAINVNDDGRPLIDVPTPGDDDPADPIDPNDDGGNGGAPLRFDDILITIEVDDFEPASPAIVGSATIPENIEAGLVGLLTASDPNHDQTVTFSIDSDPSGWFEVVGDELRVKPGAAPDHEAFDEVTLTIRATGSHADGLYSTEEIVVTITDLDEAPEVDAEDLEATLSENSANSTVVTTLTAVDPDDGAFASTAGFEIVAGNDLDAFAIDASGTITVIDSTALNYETSPAIMLVVEVSSDGDPSVVRRVPVHITVTNVAEAPEVDDVAFNVEENAPAGTVVGSVSALHLDSGETVSYSIQARDDDDVFDLDPINGTIRVVDPEGLDFEGGPSEFEWTVRATDSSSAVADFTVTFTVVDTNEAPAIDNDGFSIAENAVAGTVVGTIDAIDPDDGQEITFQIVSGNGNVHGPGIFAINRIDADSANIVVADPSKLDHEVQDSVTLVIEAFDDGAVAKRSTATFAITVTDVNEAPILYAPSLFVGASTPTSTVVGRIQAFDPEGDLGATSWSLVGSAGPFSVNSATGEIILVSSPGSAGASHAITLQATESDPPFGSPPPATVEFSIQVKAGTEYGDLNVVLNEGQSRLTTYRYEFVLPEGIEAIALGLDDPEFDDGPETWMRDSVEFALLGTNGRPVTSTISASRDAFLSLAAGTDPLAASKAGLITGSFGAFAKAAVVDVQHLPRNSRLVLEARLLNNEMEDGSTDTTATLASMLEFLTTSPVENIESGETDPPPYSSGPIPDGVTLADVTSGFEATFGRTSWHGAHQTLSAELALQSNGWFDGERRIRGDIGPMHLVISQISIPGVTLLGADGVTATGDAYYDISPFAFAGGPIEDEDIISGLRLAFDFTRAVDPENTPLSFEYRLLAPLNRAPYIESEPTTVLDIDNADGFQYDIVAHDADGDVVTLSLLHAPAGMAFDSETPTRLVWSAASIASAGVGEYNVTVQATDPQGARRAPQSFVLRVDDLANYAPLITSDPVTRAFANTEYRYQIGVQDRNGIAGHVFSGAATYIEGGITHTIDENEFEVDSETGLVTWTPSVEFSGRDVEVFFRVEDPDGAEDDQTFTLRVLMEPGNRAPVIYSAPFSTVNPTTVAPPHGYDFSFQLGVVDPDGDALAYTVTSDTLTGVAISETGLLTWAGDATSTAQHTLHIEVADGRGGIARQEYLLSINAPGPYGTVRGMVFHDFNGDGGRGERTDTDLLLSFIMDQSGSMGHNYWDQSRLTPLHVEQMFVRRLVQLVKSSWQDETVWAMGLRFAGQAIPAVFEGEIDPEQETMLWNLWRDGNATPFIYGSEEIYKDYTDLWSPFGNDIAFDAEIAQWWETGVGWDGTSLPPLEYTDWQSIYITDGHHNIGEMPAVRYGGVNHWVHVQPARYLGEHEFDEFHDVAVDKSRSPAYGYGIGGPSGSWWSPDTTQDDWERQINQAVDAMYRNIIGDPGLAGWTVYADDNGNQVLDSWEWSAVTDSGGWYELDLSAGSSHTLRLVDQSGWQRTTPASGIRRITVREGETIEAGDFGVWQQGDAEEIAGEVYEDRNDNGIRDNELINESADRLVFVFDVSASMIHQPIGWVQTPHDYQIEALQSLASTYVSAGLGHLQVAVLAFTGLDPIHDAGEVTAWVDFDLAWQDSTSRLITVPIGQDADGDGMLDVIQTLGAMRHAVPDAQRYEPLDHWHNDYLSALREVEDYVVGVGDASATTHVVFLSDADAPLVPYHDVQGDSLDAAVGRLRSEHGVSFEAVGFGSSSAGAALWRIDPTTHWVSEPEEYVLYFSGRGGEALEPASEGWTVFLDFNNNGVRDGSEPEDVTDGAGAFSFEGLTPGTYTVRMTPRVGYRFTSPESGTLALDTAHIATGGPIRIGVNTFTTNRNPVFLRGLPNPTGDNALIADHAWAADIAARDLDLADRDYLTYELASAPDGMVIHPQTGRIAWTPTSEDVGRHIVVVRVTDLHGGVVAQPIAVEVIHNRAPAFVSSPPTVYLPTTETLIYQLEAVDPDGDDANAFSYAIVGTKLGEPTPGLSISETGEIVFDPPSDGVYEITAIVTDEYGAANWQTFAIAVAPSPDADAAFTSAYRTSVRYGDTYRYRPVAIDPEGEEVTISASGVGGLPEHNPRFADGWLTWTPSVDDEDRTFTFTIDGQSTEQAFTVEVLPAMRNAAPVIESPYVPRPKLGELLLVDLVASDADNDSVVWRIEEGPSTLRLNADTGRLSWVPSPQDVGEHVVVIAASDGYGGVDRITLDLSVFESRQAPRFTGSQSIQAYAGIGFEFGLEVTDPDGADGPFEFYIVDLPKTEDDDAPSWLAIDRATGVLSAISPAVHPMGASHPYMVTVAVFDAHGLYDQTTVEILVAPHAPPMFVDAHRFLIPAIEGTPFGGMSLGVVDPDTESDDLNVVIESDGGITGLSLYRNGDEWELHWDTTAPALTDGGREVVISATDEDMLSAIATFRVYVTASTSLPPDLRIDLAPWNGEFDVESGAASSLDVRASVVDDDAEPFWQFKLLESTSMDPVPTGLTIDADSGVLSWDGGPLDPGEYDFSIRVTDIWGGSDTEDVTLSVSEPDTAAPTVPSATLSRLRVGDVWDPVPTNMEDQWVLTPGSELQLLITSENPADVAYYVYRLSTSNHSFDTRWVRTSAAVSEIELDWAANGLGALKVLAVDRAGNVSEVFEQIIDADPNDHEPTMDVGSGLGDGGELTALTQIVITVDDPDSGDTVRFKAVLTPVIDPYDSDRPGARNGDTVVLADHEVETLAAPFAFTLNPSHYAQGWYELILTATDDAGNYSLQQFFLPLRPAPAASGNSTLPFTDLSIGSAGLPLTVARTFDARKADVAGDFGLGWDSNLREMQIAVSNTEPNSRAFMDGTTIRLIMPDGRNLSFEFSGGGDDLYRYPSYTQVDDLTVFASLRVEGDESLALGGAGDTGYLTDEGLPYNPFLNRSARFVLAFSDGTESIIRASTGEIIEVRARTGERLTYGTDAVGRRTMISLAPDGAFLAALAIERDQTGRIASIVRIDDAGEELGAPLMYGYDSAGRLKTFTNRLGFVTTLVYGDEENPLTDAPSTTPDDWGAAHPNWLWQVITQREVPEEEEPIDVRALALDYDPIDGRIVRIEDPTSYGADLAGLDLSDAALGDSVTGDGQLPVEVYYDALGNIVRQVQHLGGEGLNARYLVTVFEYDLSQINQWGSSRQTGKSLPFLVEGVSRKLGWVPSTIPWESRTGYHDLGGAVAWTEDAYGNRTYYDDYDQFGNPGQIIDPLGNITHRSYDRDGRLIETIEPSPEPGKPGRTTRNVYSDETGLLDRTVELDDDGNEITTSTFGYDEYRRRVWTENLDGIRQYIGYDDEGRQDISWNLRPDTSDPDDPTPPEWVFVSTSEFDVEGRVIASRQYVIDATGIDIEDEGAIRAEVAASDPESITTTEYNSLGQVVLTTDRYGATTESLYDRRGNVIQTVQHVRDTSEDEDYGLITRTSYDSQGRAFARSDPYLAMLEMDEWVPVDAASIRITHTVFDALGRTLETRVLTGLTESDHPIDISPDAAYPELSTSSFTIAYDTTEGWEDDYLLSREHSTYDDLGRVSRQASGWFTLDDDEPVEGSLVTFTYTEYDAAGRQTATVQTWDADLDDSIDATDATGDGIPDTGAEFTRTSSEFDALGRANISTDPLGLRSKSVYDGAGRAIQSIHAYGLPGLESSVSTAFDRRGRKTHEFDQLGQVTSYAYDDAGRLISVALPSLSDPTNPDAAGRATYRYAYDAFGNRTDIWDPTQGDNDPHTTFSFDHRGRERSRTLPMGQTEWTIYEDQTLDDVSADPAARGLSTALGQVAFRIDLDGNIAAHRYDNTPTGGGRLVETKYYHRDSVTAIFVSAATTASGLASALSSLTPEEIVTYTHDAFGRVIETTQDFATGDDRTTTNTYDGQGRLTSIAVSFGTFESTVNYAYDLLGRVTRLWTGTNSASPNSDTTYTYDVQGRLRTVQATARFGAPALGSSSNPEAATTYTYDRRGGLDTITLPNGVISDSTYDAAGRLTSLTHYAPRDAGDDEDTGPFTDNEILGQYVYLLREDGRRIAAIEKHDAGTSPDNSDLTTTRWAWSYDSMGRLTQEAYDSPDLGRDYVHRYEFDGAGNRESWLKDTDPAFGSTATGFLTFDVQLFAAEVTVTYDYDANDRLLTETLDASGAADDRHTVSDWDGGGSTMQRGRAVHEGLDDTGDVVREESFTYSARGRMAGAEIDADGAGSSSPEAETTTIYTYDDHGFRIRQFTTHDSTTVVTEFVADANNPTGYTQTIEEHADGELLRSYTFGMDEIIQAVKENPAATAVVSQFLHDGRGSVRQLADALAELVTAATQGMAEVLKLDYSAYGTAVNYAAETVATALLHNGEFVDPTTGQQYLRARWYDQSSGRFNRVDPFAGEASVPQSLHKYLFAHGDPATHADPSGEIIALLGNLIGGIASWTASQYQAIGGWRVLGLPVGKALLPGFGVGRALFSAGLSLALQAYGWWYLDRASRPLATLANSLSRSRLFPMATAADGLAVTASQMYADLTIQNLLRPLGSSLGLAINGTWATINALQVITEAQKHVSLGVSIATALVPALRAVKIRPERLVANIITFQVDVATDIGLVSGIVDALRAGSNAQARSLQLQLAVRWRGYNS